MRVRSETSLERQLSDAPLFGSLLVYPTIIRLGWKGLQGTNHSSLLGPIVNFEQSSFLIIGPRALIYNNFTTVIYEFSQQARVFVPGRLFQPSLMFVAKVRNLLWGGASERCFTRVDSALLANIRLDWKYQPGIKHSSLSQTYKITV